MRSIADCTTIETKNQVCREEEGKKICFTHPEFEIVSDVVSIDKCVFRKIRGERSCDYLFLFNKTKQQYKILKKGQSIAYYVELKGNNLVDAYEQLLNSIEKTKDQIKGFDIYALIVSSRAFLPKYDNTEYYRTIKRIIRKDIQFGVISHTVNL